MATYKELVESWRANREYRRRHLDECVQVVRSFADALTAVVCSKLEFMPGDQPGDAYEPGYTLPGSLVLQDDGQYKAFFLITLEEGPNVFPKQTIKLPVYVRLVAGAGTLSFIGIESPVSASANSADLESFARGATDKLAAMMRDSFQHFVERSGEPEPEARRIGFLPEQERK